MQRGLVQKNNSTKDSKKKIWNVWESIKPRLLSALIALILIMTLAWGVWAIVIWPTENANNSKISWKMKQNDYLEVWGPNIVPGDQQFVEIHFILHQQKISNTPLRFYVNVPEPFNVVFPSKEKFSNIITIDFKGTSCTQSKNW